MPIRSTPRELSVRQVTCGRLRLTLLLLLSLGLFVQQAAAQGTRRGMATHTDHKVNTHAITGSITSVDEASKSLVVHPKSGPDLALKVSELTKYEMANANATYADLKVGLYVTVTYHVTDSDLVAKRVRVKTPAQNTGGNPSTHCKETGTCPCPSGACTKECCNG